MSQNAGLQILLYGMALLILAPALGEYMARVYQGRPGFVGRVVGPLERAIYRWTGVDPDQEMDWKSYAMAMLLFNGVGMLALYGLQRVQGWLPLNPLRWGPVSPTSAFNTAVSFVTNTDWQAYAGETTMSFLTQMMGLTVQNFLSAATGMAVAVAVIRGFARASAQTLGNFWVDLTRSVLYILLPLSVLLALFLVSQGAVQTLQGSGTVHLIQPVRLPEGRVLPEIQLPLGPVASQTAIQHLGTNGGGFFNTNAAHPFANPTPLTDFMLALALMAIPVAFAYAFGRMVGDVRQGWALLAAMLILLLVPLGVGYLAEASGNPRLAALGVDLRPSPWNPGGNMTGKEVRFGIVRSVIFTASTTGTSTGAVDAMLDAMTPLGGAMAMWLMMLGEVAPGGVGSGLYGMLAFVVVAVFVAGLMVGRTPEYLGKKIKAYEMKMAALMILIMPVLVLGLTALAVALPAGRQAAFHSGPHGFSEILYAFTSTANNNGSAFAGLDASSLFYCLTTGLAMFLGRYGTAIPALAMAGSLGRKKRIPAGAGTLPTHTPLFIAWLTSVVIIVGALNFFPALALGPVAEHLQMISAGPWMGR